MRNGERDNTSDPISEKMYTVGSRDSPSGLIDVGNVTEEELDEIGQLMKSLVRLRETEQQISEASQQYMQLGSQEMKLLHYLIVAKRSNQIVTPGMISGFLKISPASTTKILNRLEGGNHISRRLHPADRRAILIEVNPETETLAKQSVGRLQSRRFHAAARLTSSQRKTVTQFLNDMADEISLRNATWINHEGDQESG